MAVTLTSAGVTFNDSTTLNSIYNGGSHKVLDH